MLYNKTMIDLIRKYCRFSNIEVDAENEFVKVYNLIFSNKVIGDKINELVAEYSSDVKKCLEIVNKIKNLTKDLGVHEYTVNTLIYILMIPSLKKAYDKSNVPNWIFESSIKDMSYHVNYCKKIKGIYGTFTNWHENFFSMRGYGFGRLQFIPRTSYSDFTSETISIKKGEPILDVHIPNTGTPLTEEECELSYKLSAEYFKDFFGEKPIIFHCSSWLLWERHKEFLKPSSNIVKFLNRYTLVEKGLFNDYSQLWRIFEVDFNGNVDDLPINSSLQKAYYDIVKRGEKVGYGTGLFKY